MLPVDEDNIMICWLNTMFYNPPLPYWHSVFQISVVGSFSAFLMITFVFLFRPKWWHLYVGKSWGSSLMELLPTYCVTSIINSAQRRFVLDSKIICHKYHFQFHPLDHVYVNIIILTISSMITMVKKWWPHSILGIGINDEIDDGRRFSRDS